MSKKSSTTTSTVKIPPEVLARYNAVNARAEDVAEKPFQIYGTDPSAFVAQINQQQQQGIQNVNAAAGAYKPYFEQARTAGTAGMASAQPQDLDIGRYLNPYQQQVIDATMRQMGQANEQAQSGALGTAASSGAFGGDRAGIAAANLANQQGLAMGSTLAGLNAQNYNQALAAAQQQQGLYLGATQADLARLMQGGQFLAGLGQAEQQAGLQGAEAQINAGTLQQQTEQAGKSALYNQFMQEQAYPFQVAQFLANIAMGTGALSGSTTTTTQPMSWFGSDRRLKEDIRRIGHTDEGLPIYKFKYKDDDNHQTHIGFMADEVEKVKPEAVGVSGGYKMVDYERATKADGGGVAGPYGASFASSNPYAGGYVPQAVLPVGELIVADSSAYGNAQQTMAEQLAAAAAFGENMVKLRETFGKNGTAWQRNPQRTADGSTGVRPDPEVELQPVYRGGVVHRATGGAAYLQGQKAGAENPVGGQGYLSDTLAQQEKKKPPQLQTPGAAPPGSTTMDDLSNIASTAAAFATLFAGSDRRMKHDIRRIGRTDHGMPIYSFKYKGDDREQTHIGFMADEVEKHHPDAVMTGDDGYKRVDYSQSHKFYQGGVVRPGYATDGAVAPDMNATISELERLRAEANARRQAEGQAPISPISDDPSLAESLTQMRRLRGDVLAEDLARRAREASATSPEPLPMNTGTPLTLGDQQLLPALLEPGARTDTLPSGLVPQPDRISQPVSYAPQGFDWKSIVAMNSGSPRAYEYDQNTGMVRDSATGQYITNSREAERTPLGGIVQRENSARDVAVADINLQRAYDAQRLFGEAREAEGMFQRAAEAAARQGSYQRPEVQFPDLYNRMVETRSAAENAMRATPLGSSVFVPRSEIEIARQAEADARYAGLLPGVGGGGADRMALAVSPYTPSLSGVGGGGADRMVAAGLIPAAGTPFPTPAGGLIPAAGTPFAAPAAAAVQPAVAATETGVGPRVSNLPPTPAPAPAGAAAAAEPPRGGVGQPVDAPSRGGWETFGPYVRQRESGGDYDALYNFSNREGGPFAGKNVTDMTVDEALAFADPNGPYGRYVAGSRPDSQYGVATPLGAYQIVGSTLRGIKEGMGLTGDEKMTPELQDRMAQWLYDNYGESPWAVPGGATAPDRRGLGAGVPAPTKPYDERNALGKMVYDEDGRINKNFLLSVLSGLGTMASSPSVFLGSAMLQGLGGFANTYAGLEKQAADIGLTNAQAVQARMAADADRFISTPQGVELVNLGNGRTVLLGDYIQNPTVFSTGDPEMDKRINDAAQYYLQNQGIRERQQEAAATGAFAIPEVQSLVKREYDNARMNPAAAQDQSKVIEAKVNAAASAARSSIPSILTRADAVAAMTSPDEIVRSGFLGPAKQSIARFVNDISATTSQVLGLTGSNALPTITDASGENAAANAEIVLKAAIEAGVIDGSGYQELVQIMNSQPNVALTPEANATLMSGLMVAGRADIRRADFMRDFKRQDGNVFRTVVDADQAFQEAYGNQILAEKAALKALIHYGNQPMPAEWAAVLGDYRTPMEFLMSPGVPADAKSELIAKLLPAYGLNSLAISALSGPDGMYIGNYFGG